MDNVTGGGGSQRDHSLTSKERIRTKQVEAQSSQSKLQRALKERESWVTEFTV